MQFNFAIRLKSSERKISFSNLLFDRKINFGIEFVLQKVVSSVYDAPSNGIRSSSASVTRIGKIRHFGKNLKVLFESLFSIWQNT